MSTAIMSLSDRIAKELERGALEQILIKGAHGYVLMTYAGDEAILTVMAKPHAKFGLIFLDVKRTAESIASWSLLAKSRLAVPDSLTRLAAIRVSSQSSGGG